MSQSPPAASLPPHMRLTGATIQDEIWVGTRQTVLLLFYLFHVKVRHRLLLREKKAGNEKTKDIFLDTPF